MLIKDQKKSRLDISKYLLSLYEDDPKIHHFDPEAKKQRMQWKHSSSTLALPLLRNLKEFLQLKRWWPIFWDNQGFIMVDYLDESRRINGAYMQKN